MLSKAGQTAVPNWLSLFEGTYVGTLEDGSNIKKKYYIFFKTRFFLFHGQRQTFHLVTYVSEKSKIGKNSVNTYTEVIKKV